MEVTLPRQRDHSIDILKCIAAIIITNSHMELLYGKYSVLATGGAIGDALFFFCSGYTLFLGKDGSFFNWYKRRINRIYPTVFAWSIIAALLFDIHNDLPMIIVRGGGWFVTCIMIYYVLLWFIRHYLINHLKWTFAISFVPIILWYGTIGIDDITGNNCIYGGTYFKWVFFFLFMLMGAFVGKRKNDVKNSMRIWTARKSILMILIYIIFFYILCWFKKRTDIIGDSLQMLSILPLLGVCYSFYQLCNTQWMRSIYSNLRIKRMINIIGGLCFEIYLVQYPLLTDQMNSIFPLNLLVMFCIIVLAAFLLRCIARVWVQTFSSEDYNLKAIIKL